MTLKEKYINERLKSDKDDRCDKSKLKNDSYLRGQLGIKEGNRIIEMIDTYKSYR